jgi:ABC-type amino acid transport substrate-binding protein
MRSLLLLTALLMFGQVQAETLRVGIESHDYMPYFRAQPGQPVEGYAVELLQRFAADQGMTLELLPRPLNRLHHDLLNTQNLDMIFPDNPQWSRSLKGDRRLHYSHAAINVVDASLVLHERVGLGPDAVKRLGTVRGFTPQAWQDEMQKGDVQLLEANDIAGLIRMALRGRIDALYANPEVVRLQLQKMGEDSNRLMADPSLPLEHTSYHLSTVNRPQLLERFNRFLEQHAGELAALRQHYGLACSASDLSEEQPACRARSMANSR